MYEVAAAAGVSALGAIAQYYQSEKARKASQQRLDEISDMFNAIKPPQYDVSVVDPPKYITQTVPEPAVDYSKLTPKQYDLIGKFSPEVANYVAEKAPQVVKYSSQGEEGKQAQLDALRELKNRATNTGIDPVLQSQLDAASKKAQIDAQSRQQSVLQDAARRGQLGSGSMLAAQLQGGESAIDRESEAGQQAAAAAYRDKMQALRDSASLGGQISQQDYQMQSRNADILNDFNQRTSKNANQYAQYKAGLMNDAQLKNLQAAQQIANMNTTQSNDYDKYNRQMYNQAQTDDYNRAIQERGFQNQMMDKSYNNQLNQQALSNKLKSQAYGDQITQAQGKAGIANQYNTFDTQRAQDTNNMIQGFTNAGIGGAGAYGNYAQRQDDRDFQTKKARYEKTGDESIWDEE